MEFRPGGWGHFLELAALKMDHEWNKNLMGERQAAQIEDTAKLRPDLGKGKWRANCMLENSEQSDCKDRSGSCEKNRVFEKKNAIRWALQGYSGREDGEDAASAVCRLLEWPRSEDESPNQGSPQGSGEGDGREHDPTESHSAAGIQPPPPGEPEIPGKPEPLSGAYDCPPSSAGLSG